MTISLPTPPPTFQAALFSLAPPPALPHPLPIGHTTDVKAFEAIVGTGKLEAQMCSVFVEKLLYFFYGGAFYRPRRWPTRALEKLPVALVFGPRLLKRVARYFPFDTGAVAKDHVGPWIAQLVPLKDGFSVSGRGDLDDPPMMIHHLFESNERYIRGDVHPDCKTKPPPFPLLFDYLTCDLTVPPLSVDHRQCVIECQIPDDVSLATELLWVGYPDGRGDLYDKLCSFTYPDVPAYYSYPHHKTFYPGELAGLLQHAAHEAVIARYLRPGSAA